MHFSILIPSWNNLAYLKNCINAIEKNATFEHQIIVLLNEANDGSLEWVKAKEKIDYIHFEKNVGICTALNEGAKKVQNEFLIYLNDDMYVLPKWDFYLAEVIKHISHKNFMLSATMIEPRETGNKCVIVKNFGSAIEEFNEDALLKAYSALQKKDWNGSSWPPNIMALRIWNKIGGMSEAFSPGMYSDPDLSMKCWQYGIRHFQGVGKSLVYHFGSKSTNKIRANRGRKIFSTKWKISAHDFYKYYLKMGSDFCGPLPDYHLSFFLKLKYFFRRFL